MYSKSNEPVEIDWEDGARQLDECEYLFVEEIRPYGATELGLVLAEAKPQGPVPAAREITEWKDLIESGRSIESDTSCRIFEVLFDQNAVVFFSVLNESYGKYPAPPEVFSGKSLRIFTRSHLLEYISKATIACNEYPGTLTHYQISSENHVIDVITTKPPRMAVGKWSTKP